MSLWTSLWISGARGHSLWARCRESAESTAGGRSLHRRRVLAAHVATAGHLARRRIDAMTGHGCGSAETHRRCSSNRGQPAWPRKVSCSGRRISRVLCLEGSTWARRRRGGTRDSARPARHWTFLFLSQRLSSTAQRRRIGYERRPMAFLPLWMRSSRPQSAESGRGRPPVWRYRDCQTTWKCFIRDPCDWLSLRSSYFGKREPRGKGGLSTEIGIDPLRIQSTNEWRHIRRTHPQRSPRFHHICPLTQASSSRRITGATETCRSSRNALTCAPPERGRTSCSGWRRGIVRSARPGRRVSSNRCRYVRRQTERPSARGCSHRSSPAKTGLSTASWAAAGLTRLERTPHARARAAIAARPNRSQSAAMSSSRPTTWWSWSPQRSTAKCLGSTASRATRMRMTILPEVALPLERERARPRSAPAWIGGTSAQADAARRRRDRAGLIGRVRARSSQGASSLFNYSRIVRVINGSYDWGLAHVKL